ncbi:MAG: 3'(2'),5'-bisphosphate nucleotidase CysQ, partial [Helicobacter sp.]|nr:3'(2'),5'-bisphosphate nucleotidase CysQ [Helicobacter sp.]
VVYAPCFGELYMAYKGFGAFVVKQIPIHLETINEKWIEENKQLLTGDRKIKESQLVACDSIFHSTKETLEFFKRYNLKIYKCGSSLKVCTLAAGEADVYPRFNGTSEWDMAACDIILEESGGIMLDIETKKPLIYNKKDLKNNYFIAFAKSQRNQMIYKDLLAGLIKV